MKKKKNTFAEISTHQAMVSTRYLQRGKKMAKIPYYILVH